MNGQFPLEQWFFEMPICTRYWTTATVITSILVQCHVLSPFNLFYSFRTVFNKSQYWRIITTFFYFGPVNLDLLFQVFFLQRYSRLLEETSGHSPAHFSWLLFFASTCLLLMAPLFSMPFLGSALSNTLVYIWSRRNPDTLLSILGLITFKAPWLPWVLMGFSWVMHGIVPKDEICGVVVGHVLYYFNDLYPPTHNGKRPLDPPNWWIQLWNWNGQNQDETADTGMNDVQRDLVAAAAADVR